MQKKVNEIIRHLSHKHYIPMKDIEDAVKSQFLFVKNKIEEAEKDNIDTFKTIKLLSFGKFVVNRKMFKYMLENKKRKKDGDISE